MRKDDLVVVTPNSRIPRCPENFQKHIQKIQLPSGISMKKMHSLTIDNTGLLSSITCCNVRCFASSLWKRNCVVLQN